MDGAVLWRGRVQSSVENCSGSSWSRPPLYLRTWSASWSRLTKPIAWEMSSAASSAPVPVSWKL